MSAFLTSRGADFASPSANARPSAPAAGHPESLVSAVFTPPPTASIAAKQRQESVRALAAMVTAVRRLENLFLSDVAASWVPSKGLELMQAHNRSTGGASASMANGTSANSSISAATGRSPFGGGHAGGTSATSGALDASAGTTTFPPALTAAYAALGAADASDLSEVSHLFSQLRDRLYSMLAERVTVVEKRTLGTDTHRLQSAKERESTYQYGYHGGMVGGGCGVGCGVGCGDHSHHSHHHHRETSQRRRPAPAVPPVVHVTAKLPSSSTDSGAFGRGGFTGAHDDRSNSMDAHSQQHAAVVGSSSDRFSVNPAFDQTHSAAAAAFADGHASTMGRYESESPVRRAVSNEPIIRIPNQTHVVHRSTTSGAASGVAPHPATTSAAPKALSYVQYGQQQQQQQQLNASTASGSFVSAASPESLHVHSRRTQSQLAASRTTDADRSASFAGSVTGNDASGTATAGPHRVGNARARSPPRSAVVMLKGQTRMRGAPETPQSNAAAMQARKRLLVGGPPGSDGQYAAVPSSRSGNNSRSASGYQQPHDRSGSAAYGSGGFGPVGVGVESRGGALVARSPPRGRTHQQQLQEGFSYRVGAAHPTPRTANTVESSDMAAAPPSATAGSGFTLSIPDEVPSLFGGAGAQRPPPQFHDGQVFNAQEAHMQQQQASAASLSSTNFGGGGSVGGDRAMTNYAGASPPSSDVITASLRRAMNNIVDGTADAHGGGSHHNGNNGAVGGTFFPRRSPFPHASIGSAVDSNDPSPVGVPLVAAVSEDAADRMAPLRSTEQAQLIGRPATPSSALGSGLATAPPPRALTDTPLLDAAGGAFAPRSGSAASSSHHAGSSGGGAGVGNTHVKLVVRPAVESESNDTMMTAAAAGGTPPPPPPPEAATLRSGTMNSAGPMTPTTVATSGQRAATADGRPIDGGRPLGDACSVAAHHPWSSTDALDPMAATARPSSHVDPAAAAAAAAARKANSTSPVRRPQAHVDGDTGSESGGTPPHEGDDSHKKGAVATIPNTDPFAASVAASASASRGAANSRSATAKTDAEGDAREFPTSVGAIPPIGGGAKKGLPATATAAIRSTTEVAEVILLPPTRDELQWHRQALVHPLSLPAGLAARGPSPFARAGPIVPKATTSATTTPGDDAAGSVSVEGDNSRAAARRFGSARRGGSAAPVARLQALGAAAASRFMVVDVVGAGNLSGNGGGTASAFASAWVRDPAVPRGTARLLRTATAPRMANPVWGRGNGPTRIVVNTAEAMQAHQAELQKAAVAANGSTGPAPQPPALSLVVSNDLYLPEELMYEGGVALGSNSALSRDAICPCSGLARIPLTLRSERPVSQLRVPLELPGEKDPRQRVPTDGFIALRITQLAPAPARILGQPMPQPPEGATGADAYVPAAWLVMNLRRVSALPAAMLARGVFSHVDIVASFRKAAPPPQSAETNGADAQVAPAGGVAVGGEVDDGRILARCFGMPPTLADAARLAATGGDLDHDFSVGGVAAMRWPGSQNDVNALEIRLRVYVMPRPGANNASDESNGKKGKKKEDESAAAGKEQQQQPRGPRPVCVATAVLPAASVLSQRCGTLLLYAVPEPGVVEQFEKESGANSGNTGFFSRFRSKEKTATPIAAEVDSVLVEVDLTPTVETGFGAVPSAQSSSSQTPTRALIPPVTFGAVTASSLAAGLDAMPSVAVDQFFAATSAPLNPAAAGAQLAQRQREFMKFQQKAETAHEKAVVSVIGVAAVRAALESPRRARSLSPGASRGGSVPRQPSTGSGVAAAATSAPPSLPPSGGALPRRQPSGSVSSSVGATFGTDSPVAVPPTPSFGGTAASNSPPGSIPMASGIRMPVLPAQQQQTQQQHSGTAVSSPPPSRLAAPPPPHSSAAIGGSASRTAAMTDSLADASFGPNVAAAGSTSSGSQNPSSNRESAVIAPPPVIAGAQNNGIPPLAVARAVVVGSSSVTGSVQQPVQPSTTTPRPAMTVVTASAPVVVAGIAAPSSAVTPVVPTKASSAAAPAAATANGGGGGVSTSRRQIMERFRHKGSSDSESD